MVATVTVVTLGVVTAVGIGFVAFGYDLADRLVTWIGWIGGALAGGAGGWLGSPVVLGAPELTTKIGVAAGGLLAGAIVGRILLPVASRIAVVATGFVVTAGSTFVVIAGGGVTNAFTAVDPSDPTTVAATAERLAALPAVENSTQTLGIIAVVGLLGAIVAARFYTLLVTVAATSIGAMLLGIVSPLWEQALTGGVSLGGGFGDLSLVWTGIALVAGLLVQFARHGDEVDLPFVGDDQPRRL